MILLFGYRLWNGVLEPGYTRCYVAIGGYTALLFHSIILFFRSIAGIDGTATA